jgi:DNA-binding transcriptional regulator LsrR (DeoR family)
MNDNVQSNKFSDDQPIDLALGRLLFKIAQAYYEHGLTQKQIGERYGLSRMKVSRLLKQARELQIVQITLNPLEPLHADLEQRLEERFGLDEAIVVTPDDDRPASIRRALGYPAAECLLRSLHEKSSITITWGSTLAAVVDALPVESWPEVRVVQGLGGLSGPGSPTNAVELTRRIASHLRAKPLLLASPGFVGRKEVRDALMQDSAVAEVLTAAAASDIALVGIGAPTRDGVVFREQILEEGDLERLTEKCTVGDIALCFFDRDGQPVLDEVSDRLIGLTLEQIRNIPRVIGVAGGEGKVNAIRGAILGKLVNVLVTDDKTATMLLETEG